MSDIDSDSPEVPRPRYRLRSRSSSPVTSRSKSCYVSPLRRNLSAGPSIPVPESPVPRLTLPPGGLIQELKNLYCCNIPFGLMNRDLLRDHFSKFGQVVRLYLSVKKRSCTIHFKEHESARVAKLKGNRLKGQNLHIFWSKPASKPYKGSETDSDYVLPSSSAVDESEKSPSVSDRSSFLEKRPIDTDSKTERGKVIQSKKGLPKAKEVPKIKESTELPLPRLYDIPQDVAQELEIMAQSVDYEALKLPLASLTGDQLEPMDLGDNDSPRSSSSSSSVVKAVRRLRIMPSSPMTTTSISASENLVPEIELWHTRSRQQFHTPEECYQILELRDKILRMRKGKQSDLSKAEVTKGTCPDMCPEKERYQRESRQQIAFYEHLVSSNKQELIMDHNLAVKQYSRSSADQEEPLPHELRPTRVLRMTMDYLLTRIMDRCDAKDENLGEWYHFIWDRTRGIRKDITQQELCNMGTVNLVEECVRFHIHCSERLVAERSNVFDSKINSENLTKCLQTLKYMYNDLALKGVACKNEAEFRGYIILLNLNDSNYLWEMKELKDEIVTSEAVQFAMKVSTALSSNNYIRFFRLVKSTTYLNACILLRYFYQIRSKALHLIVKSHGSGRKQPMISIGELTRMLAFENIKESVHFCNHHGLYVKEGCTEVFVRDRLSVHPQHLPMTRAFQLIESKMDASVGEIIKGGPLAAHSFIIQKPFTSFNSNGTLKKEVVELSDIQDPHSSQESLTDPEGSSALDTSTSTIAEGSTDPDMQENYILFEDVIEEQGTAVEEEELEVVQEQEIVLEEAEGGEETARQKVHEMERLSCQEKAIEEAENTKSNELLTQMADEIIQEEFEIFCERLDNVAILDLDEILLDVMCNMTRDVFKEVVAEEEEKNRKKAEEEQKRKEEEETKQKEEEEIRRKKIEEIAKKHMEEILEETVSETIWEFANYEANVHNATVREVNELVDETVEEDGESILENTILKSKLDYMAVRRRHYCCKKYFAIWVATVKRVKEKRRSMEDFPAWFSPLTASQQANLLRTPPPGFGRRRQPLVIPEIEEIVMEDLRFFDFVAKNLLFETKNVIPSKYYKLVMSLPDEDESPRMSRRIQEYTDIAFPETNDLEMELPPTLFQRGTVSGSTITVSMRRVIGLNMLERGVPNEDAVCGMNGMIFVICHDINSIDASKHRLHKLLKLKKHYSPIPIAVLITKEIDASNMDQLLELESVNQEIDTENKVSYFLMKKGPLGLTCMFLKAVDWLASKHESVITPYCTSAYFLVNSLRSLFWDKFALAEALPYSDLFKIKLTLFMAIKVHNRAMKNIFELVTSREVTSCIIGAPEFAPFLPVHVLNSAGYRVMPPYHGSPEYIEMLREFFRSAEFLMPPKEPLKTKEDLEQLVLRLCDVNHISEATCRKINRYISTSTQHVLPGDGWMYEAVTKFSWIPVLKEMMSDRMEKLNFMDTLHTGEDERPILVAAIRKDLGEFMSQQWSIFISVNDHAMSKEILAFRCQFGPEEPCVTLNAGAQRPRGKKRKSVDAGEGIPPAKRYKPTLQLPDISSIANLRFGKSKEEVNKLMKVKAEIKNIGTLLAKCAERQDILEEGVRNFFELDKTEPSE